MISCCAIEDRVVVIRSEKEDEEAVQVEGVICTRHGL